MRLHDQDSVWYNKILPREKNGDLQLFRYSEVPNTVIPDEINNFSPCGSGNSCPICFKYVSMPGKNTGPLFDFGFDH